MLIFKVKMLFFDTIFYSTPHIQQLIIIKVFVIEASFCSFEVVSKHGI